MLKYKPVKSILFLIRCLLTVYYVISYDIKDHDWNTARSEVSKIAIMALIMRCEYILGRFLIDENDLGT